MKNKLIIASVGCLVSGGLIGYVITSQTLFSRYELLSKEDPLAMSYWINLENNVPAGVEYDRLVRTSAVVTEGIYCAAFVGPQAQSKVTNPELKQILIDAEKNKKDFRQKMTDLKIKYPELSS
ncbi:MAG: hypothetical protein KBC22_02125 [Candidatus Pacebacteria bacterium]|nr:hypothetical protein [Candidatus Paceibacterota bacterium]